MLPTVLTLQLRTLLMDFSWITQSTDGGPLSGLVQTIKELGAAVYYMMLTAGIAVLAVMIIVSAILIMAGGQRGRETGKVNFIWIVIGGIALFSVVAIITSLVKIGQSVNTEPGASGTGNAATSVMLEEEYDLAYALGDEYIVSVI